MCKLVNYYVKYMKMQRKLDFFLFWFSRETTGSPHAWSTTWPLCIQFRVALDRANKGFQCISIYPFMHKFMADSTKAAFTFLAKGYTILSFYYSLPLWWRWHNHWANNKPGLPILHVYPFFPWVSSPSPFPWISQWGPFGGVLPWIFRMWWKTNINTLKLPK